MLLQKYMKDKRCAALLAGCLLAISYLFAAPGTLFAQEKTEIKQQQEIHEDLYALTVAQTKIMELIDQLTRRMNHFEQIQEEMMVPSVADALINPGPEEYRSDTQDAWNAQGNATVVFTYAPEQIYKIYCRRGYLTDLVFKKGETIQFAGGGDTAGWSVSTSSVDGTPHLYIKPIVETSTTNLIVTTNRRSYHLILHSADWYNPMVTWTYAAEDRQELYGAQQEQISRTGSVNVTGIEHLDFNYKVKGKSPAYHPELIFSDGKCVYLKFKKLPQRQVPIFVNEHGQKTMTLIGYQQQGDYYIINVPFDKAQLRVNEHEIVTIEHQSR